MLLFMELCTSAFTDNLIAISRCPIGERKKLKVFVHGHWFGLEGFRRVRFSLSWKITCYHCSARHRRFSTSKNHFHRKGSCSQKNVTLTRFDWSLRTLRVDVDKQVRESITVIVQRLSTYVNHIRKRSLHRYRCLEEFFHERVDFEAISSSFDKKKFAGEVDNVKWMHELWLRNSRVLKDCWQMWKSKAIKATLEAISSAEFM